MNPLLWIPIIIVGLVLLVVILIMFQYFNLWFQAFLSKAKPEVVEQERPGHQE